MTRLAIRILGPTASGKSALALELAKRYPSAVIVNADSQQVYRGMVIGTGAPRDADKAVCDHYLYNHHSPDHAYDLGLYLKEVNTVLEALPATAIPLFVGGTGFYQRGLVHGLPDLPKDAAVRQALTDRYYQEGSQPLYEELRQRDPEASRHIHPHNRVRLLRALEIIAITGQPFSAFKQTAKPVPALAGCKWVALGISLPRPDLYEKINARVHRMFEEGLVDEVAMLVGKHGPCWALSRCLGYREVLAYLEGTCDLKTCMAQVSQNTRHYAKRQLTWFQQEQTAIWGEPHTLLHQATEWISNFY